MALVAKARMTSSLISAYTDLESFLVSFTNLPVLAFDESSGLVFDRLVKRKLRVGTMDLRIASIAIAQDAILISRNLVDFERIPDLTVEDWTKEIYIN